MSDMAEAPEASRVKIRTDVDNLEGVTSESFWAEPLGDDLYRLDNIPFYAYDLHYQDVVRAISRSSGQIPTIAEVVQPSGHKTLRVVFDEDLQEEDVQRLLDGLTARNVGYECSHGHFYTLNVPPDADYKAVCDLLWRQESAGWLTYETGSTPPAPA